jgi:hypothetical protein
MATTKGKRGIKKSARMTKGKALRPVKPLEAIHFNFGTVGTKYTQQGPDGNAAS